MLRIAIKAVHRVPDILILLPKRSSEEWKPRQIEIEKA